MVSVDVKKLPDRVGALCVDYDRRDDDHTYRLRVVSNELGRAIQFIVPFSLMGDYHEHAEIKTVDLRERKREL